MRHYKRYHLRHHKLALSDTISGAIRDSDYTAAK